MNDYLPKEIITQEHLNNLQSKLNRFLISKPYIKQRLYQIDRTPEGFIVTVHEAGDLKTQILTDKSLRDTYYFILGIYLNLTLLVVRS